MPFCFHKSEYRNYFNDGDIICHTLHFGDGSEHCRHAIYVSDCQKFAMVSSDYYKSSSIEEPTKKMIKNCENISLVSLELFIVTHYLENGIISFTENLQDNMYKECKFASSCRVQWLDLSLSTPNDE